MQNTPKLNEVSRLATGSYQKGDFYSTTDFRVDGRIDGTLTSGSRVVIGEESVIYGDIVCDNLDIYGKVEGNVFVKDTLSLKSTAVLHGDFSFGKVQIEIGAEIVGACAKMTEEAFSAKFESMIPEALKPQPKE